MNKCYGMNAKVKIDICDCLVDLVTPASIISWHVLCWATAWLLGKRLLNCLWVVQWSDNSRSPQVWTTIGCQVWHVQCVDDNWLKKRQAILSQYTWMTDTSDGTTSILIPHMELTCISCLMIFCGLKHHWTEPGSWHRIKGGSHFMGCAVIHSILQWICILLFIMLCCINRNI